MPRANASAAIASGSPRAFRSVTRRCCRSVSSDCFGNVGRCATSAISGSASGRPATGTYSWSEEESTVLDPERLASSASSASAISTADREPAPSVSIADVRLAIPYRPRGSTLVPASTSRLICTTGSSCCSTIQTRSPLLNCRFTIADASVAATAGSRCWTWFRASLATPAIETATSTANTNGLVISSIQRPQRQRRRVFDEDAIPRNRRLRPGRAVRDSVSLHRFESSLTAPRHDQLAIVVQQEQKSAGFDDGGVRRLPRRSEPENLAASRVEREELPSRLLGEAEQRVADDDRIAEKERDVPGLPHQVDGPLVAAPGRLQCGHAHRLTADDQRALVPDRRDRARRRAGPPWVLPESRAAG